MFTKNYFIGTVFLIIGTLLAACSGSTLKQITDQGADGTARGVDMVAGIGPFSYQVVEEFSIKEEPVEKVDTLPDALVLGQLDPAANENEIEDAVVTEQAVGDQLAFFTSGGVTVEDSSVVKADVHPSRLSNLPVISVKAALAELQAAENMLVHYAEIRQQVETETFNGELGDVERPVLVDGEVWTLTGAQDAYNAAHETYDQAELLLGLAEIARRESQLEAILVGDPSLPPISVEEAQMDLQIAGEALAHLREIRSLVEAEIFNGEFADVDRPVTIDGKSWTLEEARSAYIEALDAYHLALERLDSAQSQ